MQQFDQVSGGNCRLVMYRESAPGVVDSTDDGVIMSLFSESLSVSPNKQNSAVITGKRGAGKPYEGAPEYSGGLNIPVYAPLLGHVLRALCGAPTTTAETDVTLSGTVADEGEGYVSLPCTGNHFVQDTVISITGSTNYDGTYRVEYGSTATKIIVKAFFKTETLSEVTASRGRDADESFYKHEFKLPKKQPTVALEKYLDFDSDADAKAYQAFTFCKVNSLSFPFGSDGEVTIALDFSLGSSSRKTVSLQLATSFQKQMPWYL